jgi:DNA-binding CsgD family transcriptional regulator
MKLRELNALEVEALRLYALGNSSREIGKALDVHQSAALNHLRVATRKLNARNFVHGAVIASEIGLFRIHRGTTTFFFGQTERGERPEEAFVHRPTEPFEERVRMRAFDIWVEEGCPNGKDKEHWNLAMAELLGSTDDTI